VAVNPCAEGYLRIEREWQAGDSVSYVMDMPLKAIFANPAVRQLEGRVAMQRGPVIFCLEGVDHNQIRLDRISVRPGDIENNFTVEFDPGLLGGVPVVRGKGMCIADQGWGSELYRSGQPGETEFAITAVPYCVWDNREAGEMRVWLRAR